MDVSWKIKRNTTERFERTVSTEQDSAERTTMVSLSLKPLCDVCNAIQSKWNERDRCGKPLRKGGNSASNGVIAVSGIFSSSCLCCAMPNILNTRTELRSSAYYVRIVLGSMLYACCHMWGVRVHHHRKNCHLPFALDFYDTFDGLIRKNY